MCGAANMHRHLAVMKKEKACARPPRRGPPLRARAKRRYLPRGHARKWRPHLAWNNCGQAPHCQPVVVYQKRRTTPICYPPARYIHQLKALLVALETARLNDVAQTTCYHRVIWHILRPTAGPTTQSIRKAKNQPEVVVYISGPRTSHITASRRPRRPRNAAAGRNASGTLRAQDTGRPSTTTSSSPVSSW